MPTDSPPIFTPKPLHFRLAGEMLRRYLDREVSRGCHDWLWPDWFPVAEREPLVREMERRNRRRPLTADDLAEIEESVQMYATKEWGPPDWWVSQVMVEILSEVPDADR